MSTRRFVVALVLGFAALGTSVAVAPVAVAPPESVSAQASPPRFPGCGYCGGGFRFP